MILCDIGNTTYHFLVDGKHYKYFINENLPYFKGKVYYISVNESATQKLIASYDEVINLEESICFETTYVGMGLDRKIACIGSKNAIIVDAGSAITVDIMKDSKHLGGIILPGLKKFEETYALTSSKLEYEINTKVNLDKIPLCTQDAISYSILKSIILPIKELACEQLIIFTGGDGKFLSGFFDNCIYKKDLIFENMKGIIDANNCIT